MEEEEQQLPPDGEWRHLQPLPRVTVSCHVPRTAVQRRFWGAARAATHTRHMWNGCARALLPQRGDVCRVRRCLPAAKTSHTVACAGRVRWKRSAVVVGQRLDGFGPPRFPLGLLCFL